MHCSRKLIVQTLVFNHSYLYRQVSPPETLVVKGGTTWARNGRWILPENANFHVTFRDLLHAVNLRHVTNGFTSLPKEGVLRIFLPWKIRRLWPGLNLQTWVPKASMLPLDHQSCSVSFWAIFSVNTKTICRHKWLSLLVWEEGSLCVWNDSVSQGCCLQDLLDMQRSFMYWLWLCDNGSTYNGILHLHLRITSPYNCPLYNAIFLFSDPSFLITASNFTFKKYLLMNITSPFLGIKIFELCTFTLQSIFQEWVSHTNQYIFTLLCCGLISLFSFFL